MKPRVLALDLDGTIAVDDTVDLDVVAAIQEARRAGLLVVLVTGRPLNEVDALFDSPPPFDAIVAENGAVLRLPELPSPITLSQVRAPAHRDHVDRRIVIARISRS